MMGVQHYTQGPGKHHEKVIMYICYSRVKLDRVKKDPLGSIFRSAVLKSRMIGWIDYINE